MKDYAKMHGKYVARTSKQEMTIYLVIFILLVAEAIVEKLP
jgi:hypothetical protein